MNIIDKIKRLISKGAKIDVYRMKFFAKSQGSPISDNKIKELLKHGESKTIGSGSVNKSKIDTVLIDRDKAIDILSK